MTRWLNQEEQRVWRAFLEANRLLFDRLDQELQEDSDIPHTYYEILVRLSEAPDRTLRMSELAQRSLSSKSRVSHAVNRLEELGWIRRMECAGDKRGFNALLTKKGFSVLEKAAPGHVEGVRTHLFDQLGVAQVKQLGQISRAIVDHLSPDQS